MATSHAAPVTRRTFSRLENPLEVPHLIDIQRLSFERLTSAKDGLLRETINDISPIEDYTGNLAIVFQDFEFDEPTHSIAEQGLVTGEAPAVEEPAAEEKAEEQASEEPAAEEPAAEAPAEEPAAEAETSDETESEETPEEPEAEGSDSEGSDSEEEK